MKKVIYYSVLSGEHIWGSFGKGDFMTDIQNFAFSTNTFIEKSKSVLKRIRFVALWL